MTAQHLWSSCTLLLLCALSLLPCGSSFQEGDFVPIARRGQFQEVRWPLCSSSSCSNMEISLG
jgi:hypothetical protein